MNKILVPLNACEHLDKMVEAGADEFYMGFYDDSWCESLGEYSEINRMSGFREKANRYTFDEMLEVVRTVKDYGKAIFITFNSSIYSKNALRKIEIYFDKLSSVGADGVIISTPELAQIALKHNLIPVASTMCAIYNSDLVKFYSEIGVKRMILPRDLSTNEISEIVKKNPSIQYEVFLMRNGCQFSDGYCLGFHRAECGSVCGMLNHSQKRILSTRKDFNERHELELNDLMYNNIFHHFAACGLCALYRFVNLGIAAYKIVGRAEHFNGIVNDIKIVKQNIQLAMKCNSENEYLLSMKKIQSSHEACKLGMGCYYPEIRF